MKRLWISVVVLAGVYLLAWAAISTERATPSPTDPPLATPDASVGGLTERAKADAIGRVPSNAAIEVVSVTPQRFVGDDLKPVGVRERNAIVGAVITLVAVADGKDIAKLTYHAAGDKVLFVKQEAP